MAAQKARKSQDMDQAPLVEPVGILKNNSDNFSTQESHEAIIDLTKTMLKSLGVSQSPTSREASRATSPVRQGRPTSRASSRRQSRETTPFYTANSSPAVSPVREFEDQSLPALIQEVAYIQDLAVRGKSHKLAREAGILKKVVGPTRTVWPHFEKERAQLAASISDTVCQELTEYFNDMLQESLMMALAPKYGKVLPQKYSYQTLHYAPVETCWKARKQLQFEFQEKIKKPKEDMKYAVEYLIEHYDNQLTKDQTLTCILGVVGGPLRENVKRTFRHNATAEEALTELVRDYSNQKSVFELQKDLDKFKFNLKKIESSYQRLSDIILAMYPYKTKEEQFEIFLEKALSQLPSPVNTELRKTVCLAKNRHKVAPKSIPYPNEEFVILETINLLNDLKVNVTQGRQVCNITSWRNCYDDDSSSESEDEGCGTDPDCSDYEVYGIECNDDCSSSEDECSDDENEYGTQF